MMKNNVALKKYYDRTSERFWDPSKGLQGRDKIIFPLIPDGKDTFLEYGFGSASLLFAVSQQKNFSKVIGVDISTECIMKARSALETMDKNLLNKMKFMTPENDRLLQIEDKSVDSIVSVATLEHVIDPYTVLDELYRIASNKGTLVCSVPNYAYIKHRLELLLGRLPKTGTDSAVEEWRQCGWDGMHLHTFTKSAFSTLLLDCGWQPISWTGWGERFMKFIILRRKYPSLFSGEIIAVCKKATMIKGW